MLPGSRLFRYIIDTSVYVVPNEFLIPIDVVNIWHENSEPDHYKC